MSDSLSQTSPSTKEQPPSQGPPYQLSGIYSMMVQESMYNALLDHSNVRLDEVDRNQLTREWRLVNEMLSNWVVERESGVIESEETASLIHDTARETLMTLSSIAGEYLDNAKVRDIWTLCNLLTRQTMLKTLTATRLAELERDIENAYRDWEDTVSRARRSTSPGSGMGEQTNEVRRGGESINDSEPSTPLADDSEDGWQSDDDQRAH